MVPFLGQVVESDAGAGDRGVSLCVRAGVM